MPMISGQGMSGVAGACAHPAGSFSKDAEIHCDGEEQLAIRIEVAAVASLYEGNRLSCRVAHVAEANLILTPHRGPRPTQRPRRGSIG